MTRQMRICPSHTDTYTLAFFPLRLQRVTSATHSHALAAHNARGRRGRARGRFVRIYRRRLNSLGNRLLRGAHRQEVVLDPGTAFLIRTAFREPQDAGSLTSVDVARVSLRHAQASGLLPFALGSSAANFAPLLGGHSASQSREHRTLSQLSQPLSLVGNHRLFSQTLPRGRWRGSRAAGTARRW